MEALGRLKGDLQRAHSPVVMVLAHPAVEAACAKDGLSLAELLRPFGVIRQLNGTVGGALLARGLGAAVPACLAAHLDSAPAPTASSPATLACHPAVPVRTPAEHPLRLHSWRLRFYTAATMFQPTPEAADTHLQGVLAEAAADAAASEVPELPELLRGAGKEGSRGCGSVWAVVMCGDAASASWQHAPAADPLHAGRHMPCRLNALAATPYCAGAGGEAAPWYRAYHREFLRMLQFGEHETLDHPVACERAAVAPAAAGMPAAAAAGALAA